MIGQRPAAIVSPQAGTTRDVLESALDIRGYPIVIRCNWLIVVVISTEKELLLHCTSNYNWTSLLLVLPTYIGIRTYVAGDLGIYQS